MKTFLLPRKNKLIGAALFIIAGGIDFVLSSYLCNNGFHIFFFCLLIVGQFYFIIEFANSYTDHPVFLDFRSHEEKLDEQFKTQELMIEATKHALALQALEGKIREHDIEERLQLVEKIRNTSYTSSSLLDEYVSH